MTARKLRFAEESRLRARLQPCRNGILRYIALAAEVIAALGLVTAPLASQSTSAPAQTLTVRLFTTVEVRSLLITPLGSSAIIARCPACPPQPLHTPIHIDAVADGFQVDQAPPVRAIHLFGSFHIKDANPPGKQVTASGQFHITPVKDGLRVLLDMPSERYVVAALNGEAAPDEPVASLKAMAVTIRTFALVNANRHAREGFGLCDDTHCQSLRLEPARPEVEQAVLETAGETLWFPAARAQAQRASVYYAQNCGGATEDVSAVWPDVHAPYLAPHPDPYCVRRGRAAWHADIRLDRLAAIARAEGWKLPASISAFKIVKRTPSGRALLLEVTGNGSPAQLSASSLRFAVDRTLGWNTMRSDAYEIHISSGVLHLEGNGFGHGVGLCQAGAFEMAKEGKNYREILAFYFPGTSVGLSPLDAGWTVTEAAGWTLRSVTQAPALKQSGDAAWARARQLFPPRGPASQQIKPTVFAAPSTELFRQLTGEPGWTLAATQGTEVFLQPEAILRRHDVESETLLHEFLHVLVEAEASPGAQLWLREGLVEALATSHAPDSPSLNSAQIDSTLAHPSSQAESQRAHSAAAALVAHCISRYGAETVRGWLRTGVPTSAVPR